jgi:phosphatidylserine/phosphatidylglycerophosphate/cardiolipin synthase-like enzyme
MGVVVLRRTLAVVVAALLIGTLSPSPAQASDTWIPGAGTGFNQPVSGAWADRTRLVRRVIDAINHTPKYGVIRIAAYSFDRKDVADALVRAHWRGARVQIVLNDNWVSPQTRRLMRVLGRGASQDHFVVVCSGSCRGGAGNLHMKVYSFSQTGAAKKVIMTGSANMTDRAVTLQWNDLVTLRDSPGLFDAYVKVFNQLKYDRAISPSWVYYEEPGMTAQFYRTSADQPRQATTTSRIPTADEDPVMQRLKAIKCDALEGSGVNGKTQLRIVMYGWNGDRGLYLSEQVARLKRLGCDVKIITSVAGGGVIKTLNESSVPVRSADYKFLEDGTVDFYSHLKMMWVNGTYKDAPTRMVWTGSENWSEMSFKNDELCVGLTGPSTVQKYKDQFDYMWQNYTHKFGIHPLDRPPYVG